MQEVKFPRYRQYLEQRQLVNSAVMALLAGAHLGINTLRLTEGSDRPLKEIFPRVPHIERFNLRSEVATELLADAEAHLSAMAIPYILTIHESLFGTFEEMLKVSGATPDRKSSNTSPVWIVRDHWRLTGRELDDASWLVFSLIAELRHDVTHRAGVAGPRTVFARGQLTSEGHSLWERMSGEPVPMIVEGRAHVLDHADMIVCLAVTKFLAREGNLLMQECYPRQLWLKDFTADVVAMNNFSGNLTRRVRKARSWSRINYGALNFTDAELGAEIRAQMGRGSESSDPDPLQ